MRYAGLALLLSLSLVARAENPPPSTAAPAVPAKVVPAPALQPGQWGARGDEAVLADLAVIPMEFLRKDLNGTLVPGGFRLATWANLSSRAFAGDRVRIVTSFRFDLDTSATQSEVAAFKPYLSPTRYNLLAAYIEADGPWGLQLRAGRQFHADSADFLAFDGGKLLWTIPKLPVRLELYGGVRSSFLITTGAVASSLYELDGVTEETGTPQPIAGAVLRYLGSFRYRSEASVGFRWSWRTPGDEGVADPALPTGFSTTAEELSAAAGTDVGPVHLFGAAGYELVLQSLMRARASATLELGRAGIGKEGSILGSSAIGLEYRRYKPTFALDSIFNYFSINPYDEYSILLSGQIGPRIRAEVRGFERVFHANTTDRNGNDVTISPGDEGAHGYRATAYAQLGQVLADVQGQVQLGYGGTRLLLDGGARRPFGDHFVAYARASLARYDLDEIATGTAGNSLGLIAGGTYYLPQGASMSLIVEETLNPATTRVPRVFGVVDFARWL